MDDIQSWWEVPSIAHFCSLFRAAFNLLDFDIEELEEALLTDGAEDAGTGLIQELIVRLICGCLDRLSGPDVSTFNYQMFLRRLFRQKCQECGRDNPFNTDIDFQFLPLRTKVEILHALCDFRLDAEDVQELLKNLDSDSLRVIPLGYDENSSAYWYFYGTRLYKEDYTKVQKKKAKEKRKKVKEDRRRKKRGKSSSDSDDDDDELGTGVWQVVCFSEHDWDKLTQSFKGSTSKVEKALYRTLAEDFLPEIPRLFAEKERLQRKRLLEYQPRRQSSRLEKLKQQKVEEEKILRKEEKLRLLHDESSKSSMSNTKEDRISRAIYRSLSQTASECGSLRSLSDSQLDGHSNRSSTKPVGRQTNNSLASATGQIVIQGLRRKLRSSQVFKQSDEDLQTGMYKILEHIKNHKDAWPFVEPVEEEYAPRYYSIVTKPMDLQRMEDKLDEGEYLNFNDFKADFELIVDNCRKYNGTENEYTEMVGTLQEAFELAVERYLDSDYSSDEEIAVEFPLSGDTQTEQPSVKHRARRKEGKLATESTPSVASNDTAQSLDGEDKEIKDDKSETMGEITDTEDSATKDGADSTLRQPKSSTSSRLRKTSEVIKNAAAIEALELATEQTLKDINKWLDDTPRFSEFSSASNSPSHFINNEEFDVIGTKIESEYKSRLKLERPLRAKDSKEPLKRRPNNKDPSKHRRREPQRTIERLQPGKSKGNLISNMQIINAIKQAKEEASLGLKPKENRNSLVVKTDEMTPKLSLGTVLTSDVMAFDVGQTSHSFDAEVKPEPKKLDPDDELLEASPKVVPSRVSPEPQKIEPNSLKRKRKEDVEETKDTVSKKPAPNLNAWFKAFGAPKPPPATPKRKEPVVQEEVEVTPARRPSPTPADVPVKSVHSASVPLSVRTIHDVARPDAEVPRKESPEDADRFPHPRYEEASSPHQQGGLVRQRRVSTGSSMSERSSFSQDPSEPLDSSPRLTGLMLDERLGGYPSAPYPSPLHRSPMAPSPLMVSPRTDELPKPPAYPPPNGTIRVGFYQEKSPEKSPQGPPPPSYPPTGYLPQSTPPLYDPYGVMPYYDTSKSLTDQYHAARTQVVTAPTPTYTAIVQKPSATMFPVKKRLYSEVSSHQRITQPVPLPPDRSPMGLSINGVPTDPPLGGGQMKDRTMYTQGHPLSVETSVSEHHTASRHHQLPNKVSHIEKLSQPANTLPTSSISLLQSNDRLQYTYSPMDLPHKDTLHQTNIVQKEVHHQSVPPMSAAQVSERVQQSGASIQGFPHQDRIQTAMASLRSGEMTYRGPFSPGPPVSLGMDNPLSMRGNLANLSHIVDRYSTDDRLLQQQPYYGDKGLFGQGAPTTLQQSLSSSVFSQSPAVMTMAYNRDSPIAYNRPVPELSSVLSNKVGNIQSPYNRNVSELSGMLPTKSVSPLDMQLVYNRPELSSMLQNKVSSHSQPQYNRPLSDLSLVPNKATPSIDMSTYNTSGSSYNRGVTDYSTQHPSKVVPAEPVAKPSRKRKTKQTVQPVGESAGFQHYSSIKSTEQSPIALKTASVVPGSAFNFGPAPSGLGLYGEKEGYTSTGFLDEYRPPSGYYMHTPEPSSDKVSQGSPSPFPFLSHPQPRPPTYPQLSQAFMNPHQTLMEASGYQYFRHQEELLRHSASPMVLHQGLLAPPTSYPPGYHPALGMRQPYDRPSWL